jgi:hypothetical protein
MKDKIEIQNEIKNAVWMSKTEQPVVEWAQLEDEDTKFLVQSHPETGAPSDRPLSSYSQQMSYRLNAQREFIFGASAIFDNFWVGNEQDFFSFQAQFVQQYQKIQKLESPNKEEELNKLIENRGLHINLYPLLSGEATTKSRMNLQIDDNPNHLEKLKTSCEETFNALQKSFEQEEPIFVNCQQGVSRSVTVVLYFLIRYFKVDALAACYFVKSKRPEAGPIPAFFNFLYNEGKQYKPQRDLEFFRSWVEAKDTQENFFNRLKQVEIGSQKWIEPDQKQTQNQDGSFPKTWEKLGLNDAFIGLMTLLECLGISDEQYYKVEFSKRSFNLTFHNEKLQAWFVGFFKDNDKLSMDLIETSIGQIKAILQKDVADLSPIHELPVPILVEENNNIDPLSDLVSEINKPEAKSENIIEKAKKCLDEGVSIPESVVVAALKKELEKPDDRVFMSFNNNSESARYLLSFIDLISKLVTYVYKSGQSISEGTLISFSENCAALGLPKEVFEKIVDWVFTPIRDMNGRLSSSQENHVYGLPVIKATNNNSLPKGSDNISYVDVVKKKIKALADEAALKTLSEAIESKNEGVISEICEKLIASETKIPWLMITKAIEQRLSKQTINQITDGAAKTSQQGLPERIFINIITSLGENYDFDEAFFTNLLGAVGKSRSGVTQESLKKAIELGQWPNIIAICKKLQDSGKPVDEQRFIDIVTKVAGQQPHEFFPEDAMLAVINAVANSGERISENVLTTIFQLGYFHHNDSPLFLRVREIVRDQKVAITASTLNVVIQKNSYYIQEIFSDMAVTKQPISENFILNALKARLVLEDPEFLELIITQVVLSGGTISEATLIGLLDLSKKGSDKALMSIMVERVINSIHKTGGQLLVTQEGETLSGDAVEAIRDYFEKPESRRAHLGHIKFVLKKRSENQNIPSPGTPKVVATKASSNADKQHEQNVHESVVIKPELQALQQPLVVSQGQEQPNNLQGQIHLPTAPGLQEKINAVTDNAFSKMKQIDKSHQNQETKDKLKKDAAQKQGEALAQLFIEEYKTNKKPLAFIYSGNYMQLLSLKAHYERFAMGKEKHKFSKLGGLGQAIVINSFMQKVNLAIQGEDIPSHAIEILVIPTSLCGGSDSDPANQVSFSILNKVFEDTRTKLIENGYHIYGMYDEERSLNLGGGISQNFSKVLEKETDPVFRQNKISRRRFCDVQIAAIRADEVLSCVEENDVKVCSIRYLPESCSAEGEEQISNIVKEIPENATFLTTCNIRHYETFNNKNGIEQLEKNPPKGLMKVGLGVYKGNKNIKLFLFPTIDISLFGGEQKPLTRDRILAGLRNIFNEITNGTVIYALQDVGQEGNYPRPRPLLTGTVTAPTFIHPNEDFEDLSPQIFICEYLRAIQGKEDPSLHPDLRPLECALRLAVLGNNNERIEKLKAGIEKIKAYYPLGDVRIQQCEQLLKIGTKKSALKKVVGIFFPNDNNKPKGPPKGQPKHLEGAPPTTTPRDNRLRK